MSISLRKKFFAWILKKGDPYSHKLYGAYKRELFREIKATVVEIGPGTGVNFQYLPPGINWIGIEPNEAFHEVLLEKAKQCEINAVVLNGVASEIPLPGNSADVLISTLVLCSVKLPAEALAEAKRVLKPGGKLIFMEHVAAPQRSFLRRAQNIFNPVNRIIADGCNCNRETWNDLQGAGFEQLELSHHDISGTLKLHSPHIMGFALK